MFDGMFDGMFHRMLHGMFDGVLDGMFDGLFGGMFDGTLGAGYRMRVAGCLRVQVTVTVGSGYGRVGDKVGSRA